MAGPIRGIDAALPLDTVSLGRTPQTGDPSFGKLFHQAVDRVEQLQSTGQEKVDRFMRGEDQEVHDLVLSVQRADLAFEYFMQMRNKAVQAYQEIMRMQM